MLGLRGGRIMGMFDPDEDPTYIKMESQLDKIKKILKADFLNDKEKLFFIERIIFEENMKGDYYFA